MRTATVAVLCASLTLCGCGEKRVSMPGRTATEQMLITAAADRAIEATAVYPVKGKKVFFDTSSFEASDQKYVIAQWQASLARQGAVLQPSKDTAELVITPRSGSLSVDSTKTLLGLPELFLPIPLAGNVQTPELYVWKLDTYTATGKFAAQGTDPADNSCVFDSGHHFGQARERHFWFMFFGPFTFSDVKKHPSTPYRSPN